jgi:hypothetical protein
MTKISLRILSFALLIAIALPASASIVNPNSTPASTTTTTEDPRAMQLVQRLEHIKGIDRSTLTKSERKELRKEVKEIKKEMKAIKGGVYLSVGAIIIIILVLILIL